MEKWQFTSIRIRKAPGFPDGLIAGDFKRLSPDITLITGPNGAGKSTTARILSHLVWNSKAADYSSSGEFLLGKKQWNVDLDVNYIKYQAEGQDSKPEGIPAVEMQDKYTLALHELVNLSEGEIAKAIANEASGGYDIDKARDTLAYSSAYKTTLCSEYKNFSKTRENLEDLKKTQFELKVEEDKLTGLKKQLETAQKAAEMVSLYERLYAFIQAKQNLEEKRNHIESFPKVMSKLNGEEILQLDRLEDQITYERNDIESAEKVIQKNKTLIEELPLPDGGIDQVVLAELGKRIDLISDYERDIRENNKLIEHLRSGVSETEKALGSSVTTKNWEGVDLDLVYNLEEDILNAFDVTGDKMLLEKEINRISGTNLIEIADTKMLEWGIRFLGEWLKEQKGKPGVPLTVSVLSIVICSAVLFFVKYLDFWLRFGIPPLLILLIVIFYFIRKNGDRQKLLHYKEEFLKTGLAGPDSWNNDDVARLLGELCVKLGLAAENKSRAINSITRKQDLDEKLMNLTPRLDKLNNKLNEWKEKIGAVPELSENAGDHLAALFWFVKHAGDWQKANVELQSAIAKQDVVKSCHREELDACNRILSSLDLTVVNDSTVAKTIYDKLVGLENQRSAAQQTLDFQTRIKEDCEKRLNTAVINLNEIYEKLSVEKGQKENIVQLIEMLSDYRQANSEYYSANDNFTEKQKRLMEHSLYPEVQDIRDVTSIGEVDEYLQEQKALAHKHFDIRNSISEIERNVREAKRGRVLEDAIAQHQDSLYLLGKAFDDNLSSITGHLLAEHLKNTTEQSSQPEVLKRANRLFGSITKNRYTLKVTDHKGTGFIAYDNVMRKGLKLEQISTGTRVQLLLSVRLAFIEAQENKVRLPLFVDELLANSDDERANAIIEALVAICKSGRQIFYLTARPDEVWKWKSYIENNPGTDFQIINLRTTEGDEDAQNWQIPSFDRLELSYKVPEPLDGSFIEDYRVELNVPHFDLLTHSPEQLHVAKIINDTAILYECLKTGIVYWGQLVSFMRNNGIIEGLSGEAFRDMTFKIKLLEYFQELYLQGRSRPIGTEVLLQSKAVSDKFMESVMAKLDEVNGDPRALMDSLKERPIPQFRENKMLQLKEFLINNEYLTEETTLSEDEIKIRLEARISQLGLNHQDAGSFINVVLGHAR